MTASMPNPFDTGERFETTAFEFTPPSEFKLNEPAFLAALLDMPSLSQVLFSKSNPALLCGADVVAAAGLAIAPLPDGSAAATANLDSEKNIAMLLALAAIDTASADHSSIPET